MALSEIGRKVSTVSQAALDPPGAVVPRQGPPSVLIPVGSYRRANPSSPEIFREATQLEADFRERGWRIFLQRRGSQSRHAILLVIQS